MRNVPPTNSKNYPLNKVWHSVNVSVWISYINYENNFIWEAIRLQSDKYKNTNVSVSPRSAIFILWRPISVQWTFEDVMNLFPTEFDGSAYCRDEVLSEVLVWSDMLLISTWLARWSHPYNDVTWTSWRLKLPATRMFVHQNSKATQDWLFVREHTDPSSIGQQCRKHCHAMTSSL